MKIIRGILLLLAFFGAGTLLSNLLHIPLPGNLLGMLLLTMALCAGWVRMDWVEQASGLLIRHMMLFFVPIIVGVAAYLKQIASDPWPIVLAMLLGPISVMFVTGKLVQWYVTRHKQKQEATADQQGRALDV